MWRKATVVVSGLLLVACTAMAAPENGFGVYGGYASHTSDGKFTEAPLTGVPFTIDSSGLSLGLDYQFALSDSFSLNLFLMSSSESADSDELIVDRAGHGILGIEGRLWFDQWFAGAHVGRYSEVVSSDTGGDISGNGPGYGIVLGMEQPGGLFFTGQFDWASIDYNDAETDLTGFRLHVGYRWK